jgi:hypothetical protein
MIPRPAEDEESAPEHEAKQPRKQPTVKTTAESAEETTEPASEDAAPADADAEPEAALSGEAAAEEAEGSESSEGSEGAASDEASADDPAFEVSDRRASITVDREGVRFTLDGEAADFRWDEIGAVEVGIPRFGRRFTVTVHTLTRRRQYHVDVDAPTKSALKEWSAELDEVLDAYFEDA